MLRILRMGAIVLALVAVVSMMSACSRSERIRVGTVPALMWAAWSDTPNALKAKGSSVDVELVPFKSSADVFVALTSGQIDIASVGMNVVVTGLATNPDLPLTAVAGVSPGRSQLLLRSNSGINDWNDIRGRNIGVIRGSTDELIFKLALAHNGIDMDKDTKVTTLQASADLLLALRNGDVDAVVTYQPTTAQAVSQGIVTMPASMNADLLEWASVPVDVFARNEILESNPDGVQQIIDAYVEVTNSFVDKQRWVDTTLKFQSGDKDLLLDALTDAAPWYRMDQSMHRTMASAMAEYGMVPTDLGDLLADRINYDFLAKAVGKSAAELGKTEGSK